MKRQPIPWVSILRDVVRWSFLVIIFAGLSAICLAQRQGRASRLKIVQLSAPRLAGPVSFEQAAARRRSVRQFTGQPLNFTQIGQLAWAGQGITDKQRGFRTTPSAGALYPMELYFATPEAMFVYRPDGHILEETFNQDVRERLARAALKQEPAAEASCDIIVAGSVKKLSGKYGNKARRYMLLEAGHIAQNIQLQAVSLGLGSVTIGAFDINQVRKVCKLPTTLEPLYIICVGYPAGQSSAETGEQEKQGIGRR